VPGATEDRVSSIGEVLENEETGAGAREELVRSTMQERIDSMGLPPGISAEDRMRMAKVRGNVPLDRASFGAHLLLDSSDVAQINPRRSSIGRSEVDGLEVEINPHGSVGLDRCSRDPEVKHEGVRAKCDPKVPLGLDSILLEQGMLHSREVNGLSNTRAK
jgi:hypothetical protein